MVKKITLLIIGIVFSGISMAQPGNALNFDGANDMVVVPNNSALEFATGTIELWLKPDWVSGTAGYNPGFIGLRDASGTRFSFHIKNNYSALDIYNGSVASVTYAFSQGEWYHIALVLKSSTTDVYINGIYQGTMNQSVNQGNTGQNLNIGSSNGTGEYFNGEIDEVRIWSIQRTGCEIISYRNTELLGNEDNLLAYYNFNQGVAGGDNPTDTILTDHTSNSFDGELSNFALEAGSTSNWIVSGADVTTIDTPVDNIPPQLLIPADTEISCGSDPVPSNTGMGGAADVCDPGPVLSYSDVYTDTSVIRTWIATDASGNETTGEQIITIIDNTAPVTPVLDTLLGETSITAVAPTTTDNCAGTITGTTFDSVQYNEQGIYIINWIFDDGSGNSTTADQTVIVNNGQNMLLEFNTNLSSGTTITLPLNGTVDVTVFWGDGTSESTTSSADLSHTYSAEGTYTVMIIGSLTHYGRNEVNSQKLTRVTNFGNLGITDFSYAFRYATNLTEVPSTLPAGVTNTASMFRSAGNFNGNIGGWDVSAVTDMSYMFNNATSFNADISNWNVSKVEDMTYLFGNTPLFNANISNWVVSSATTMYGMFNGSSVFNQNIGGWNVSAVTDMSLMFAGAEAFNQDLNNWNVGNVTQMGNMFGGSTAFNGNITNWNVSKVENMSMMFNEATSFDQDLSSWDVSLVSNMGSIFQSAGLSTTNYDAILNAWSVLSLQSNVSFHAGTSTYSCLSEAARAILVNTYNWNIYDGGAASDDVGISTHPRSSTSVYEGTSDIVLSIGASGDLEINYQWYKDDVVIATNGTSETLTIATDLSNSGTYYCIVTSVCGASQQSTNAVVDIVDDVTAPITPTLADLSGECSVTATAPTTTDAIAGNITATTSDPLEYTQQGTYTITWTFDDGNGNSTTAQQTVIVEDVTAPVTPTLTDLTGECSVTATASTTTDACAGTITGTTSDPTEYTEQGTYTITWTFDDSNGNSTTADQTVIVEDVTAPTLSCLSNQTVSAGAGSTYTVQGTEFDLATAEDNCGVANIENDYNNSASLSGAQFPVGTTTVTWTVTDNEGNTNTCSFDVVVNSTVGFETLEQKGIKIYPNPVLDVLKLDVTNNQIQKLIISDLLGKQLIQKTSINKNATFDLSGFDEGIYLISIQTDNKVITSKIVKK
jgi:surface protein